MAIETLVKKNITTAEQGKFVELVNDSEFPPISVIRWEYPDTTTAFQPYTGAPLSSIDIYPKYAVLVYPVGLEKQLTTITNVLCALFNKLV